MHKKIHIIVQIIKNPHAIKYEIANTDHKIVVLDRTKQPLISCKTHNFLVWSD